MDKIKGQEPQNQPQQMNIVIEKRDDLKHYLKNAPTEISFIKFGASWCRPCQMIAPTIKSLNEQVFKAKKEMTFIDLDVDQCSDLYAFMKQKKMVKGIPVIMCYKKSEYKDDTFYIPSDSFTGASPQDIVNLYRRNIS
jgi:thiol-disulfide isomerase/thioredoxin